MKLTEAQLRKLLRQFDGTGYLIVKTADKSWLTVNVHLGSKGTWYTGTMELTAYLETLKKEIQLDE